MGEEGESQGISHVSVLEPSVEDEPAVGDDVGTEIESSHVEKTWSLYHHPRPPPPHLLTYRT